MKRLILAAVISALAISVSLGGVPPVLNHQGMLTHETGMPLTGDYNMIFRLYDVPTGGTELWGESQLVTVTSGVFNVYLGEVTPLDETIFTGQDIWLGVTVEEDDEMTPRLRLGSVLYAFAADHLAASDILWYEDFDEDGYGNPDVWVTSATQPVGYVADNTDCNDQADYIHPGAEEFCDGLDYNCDEIFDEGMPCDDGDPCTTDDTCVGGICAGIPMSCDDGNLCTADVCDGMGGCENIPEPGNPCDDGNSCTVNDMCNVDGSCTGDSVDCSDGIPCTDDYCNPDTGGCVNTLQSGTCYIDGQCYLAGDRAPFEECLECNPAVSTNSWSSVADGTPCAIGECEGGTCTPQFR